jgi:hypothetical protein
MNTRDKRDYFFEVERRVLEEQLTSAAERIYRLNSHVIQPNEAHGTDQMTQLQSMILSFQRRLHRLR